MNTQNRFFALNSILDCKRYLIGLFFVACHKGKAEMREIAHLGVHLFFWYQGVSSFCFHLILTG
ncbi:hypothetical protein Lspi_2153 [Legionella spiritensis]|uniref:Uncharacterized protein n=1 Tax=Legionella spiritensis TaxID=452 RepID=A0A0W0YY49_LEGSP|nr:hypothetical protein Lspi_2153 [Legionella spiritensis]SNV32876.1 Uncharacterised protein [Legionella spiritensis]VEG92305.1 Uncharacterised protein [Legionella spiritensis]